MPPKLPSFKWTRKVTSKPIFMPKPRFQTVKDDILPGRLVIETLKEVEKDRKCFRMIGGVLVERTVNEVLPALEQNRDQVSSLRS